MTRAKSTPRFFDKRGKILFGKHLGKPAHLLPEAYVLWAKENIEGFGSQYVVAKGCAPLPQFPIGRKYTLDRSKLHPSKEEAAHIEYEELYGGDLFPPSAFDIGGDF